MKKQSEIVICPQCGGEIRSDAQACRHCGSDEQTGWSDKTYLDGIDLPDAEEYDNLVTEEFGETPKGPKKRKIIWVTWCAIGLIILFIYATLRQFL